MVAWRERVAVLTTVHQPLPGYTAAARAAGSAALTAATYADDFPALREHITGVPTLLYFDNGAITRYEGPRTADSIIETTMKHFSI